MWVPLTESESAINTTLLADPVGRFNECITFQGISKVLISITLTRKHLGRDLTTSSTAAYYDVKLFKNVGFYNLGKLLFLGM